MMERGVQGMGFVGTFPKRDCFRRKDKVCAHD